MNKGINASLVFIIVIILITMSGRAQSMRYDQAIYVPNSKFFSENKVLTILGIDSTAFPKIKINVFINKLCALAGTLKKDNFKAYEDGIEGVVDNFYFTGNASGQKLDLALVFDETNSMNEEINALKLKVRDLTQKINSSKLDARYSLVTFNGSDVATKINWTNDADYFRSNCRNLSTSGGNSRLPENSLDGIEKVVSNGFRDDAQKVIIVVTDEPSLQKGDGKSNSAYTVEDVKSDLLNSSAMLIAVSPDFRNRNVNPNVRHLDLPKYADVRELANDASGLWIDIQTADFSAILDQIQRILTGTYVIEYTSPDQTPSENRTVLISVDLQGCVEGSDSSSYITPGSATSTNYSPFIEDLASTLSSPQEAGTIITWSANASDVDGDVVLYRFILNDKPKTDWTTENKWTWVPNKSGSYRIEVRVRDGKHAGPNGLDDRKIESYAVIEPNASPTISTLLPDRPSNQYAGTSITWTAIAEDNDKDPITYRFILNDKPETDWTTENKWTWVPNKSGSYRIEVRVRDGKHAGPSGLDDRMIESFMISQPKPKDVEQANRPPIINDLTARQDEETSITWIVEATDLENDPIRYRFILNRKPLAEWIIDNKYTISIDDVNVGDNIIEAQIRDGRHKGPTEYDDSKSTNFSFSSTKMGNSVQPLIDALFKCSVCPHK